MFAPQIQRVSPLTLCATQIYLLTSVVYERDLWGSFSSHNGTSSRSTTIE